MKITFHATCIAALLALSVPAAAADLTPTAAPVKAVLATPVSPPACSAASTTICSGAYLGVEIGGVGASTSQSGVSSALAAGGIMGGDIGWQYWSAIGWGVGFETRFDYDATGVSGGSPGFYSAQLVRPCGALSFLTGNPSPSQGPITFGPFTNIIPCGETGVAERQVLGGPFAIGWVNGAALLLPMGGKFTAKVEYDYTTYNFTTGGVTLNSENKVTVGLNYHF
jgi:hypothetical protein